MKYNIREAHRINATILPDGTLQSRNSFETKRNNNILIFGTSGSGKTRSAVIPNICTMLDSYIISDPKGNLFRKYAPMLKKHGYQIRHLNFIHPEQSEKYNPLLYLRTSDDIMKFSKMLIEAQSTGKEPDPFWKQANLMLMTALISFLTEMHQLRQKYHEPEAGRWKMNLMEIPALLACIDSDDVSEGKMCEMDTHFQLLQRLWRQHTGKESPAFRQWKKFNQNPQKTLATVIMTLQATLAELDTDGIRYMFSGDNMQIEKIGMQKTAVFIEISDTDRSKDLFANIFYGQAMNTLCSVADVQPDSRLPVPVQFILDDFGTNCRIDGFENMIANIRSRNISVMLMLQSQSQLEASYDISAHTIMENCDTTVYMGGNDPLTAETIAKRCNVPVYRILNMPLSTNWTLCRGEKPRFGRTVDIAEYVLLPEYEHYLDIP